MTRAARNLESDIRSAALKLAQDHEICAMLGVTPAELAPYREVIDKARASAMVSLRYHRMVAQARQTKRKAAE